MFTAILFGANAVSLLAIILFVMSGNPFVMFASLGVAVAIAAATSWIVPRTVEYQQKFGHIEL